MVLSMKVAINAREEAERCIKEKWGNFIYAFIASIPQSCRKFFDERAAFSNPESTLKWFDDLIANTREGMYNEVDITGEDLLIANGFSSYEDLRAAMHELEEVWDHNVQIAVHFKRRQDDSIYGAEIFFFAKLD